MTREEILAMPAGRELDALVAEKVMGWILEENRWLKPNGWPIDKTPNYSTDISAAWEVVEKITQEYRITLYKLPGGEWSCKFSDFPQVIEPTTPEAIAKSALLTVLEGQTHDL